MIQNTQTAQHPGPEFSISPFVSGPVAEAHMEEQANKDNQILKDGLGAIEIASEAEGTYDIPAVPVTGPVKIHGAVEAQSLVSKR